MILTVPRRVLMTTDTVGGVWRYSMELSGELVRQGAEVVLASMGRLLSADQWAEALSIDGLMVEESDYRLEWMSDCEGDLDKAGKWLLSLAGRHRPDLVHLNQYAHGTLPWMVPVVMTAHSCVPSWWRAVKKCEVPADWDDYRARTAAGLRAADLVTAPTVSFLREVSSLHGPFRRACVVYNGHSGSGVHPVAEKEPFVFAAGRVWDEAKNIKLLADVAGDVPWPVVVAGEGREVPGVQCLGQLSPIATSRWMGRAAVFASPSLYEPFGLAVLEAALSECALVLSDIGTFRELWNDAAVFVNPSDPSAWAAALSGLAADEGRRAELGRAARRRARDYSADRMAAETLAAYASLASRPQAYAV